jgi:endo-1,4-beta-xylanase
MNATRLRPACLAAVLFAAGCAPHPAPQAAAPLPTTLREAFQGAFLVGAAVNADQFSGRDERGAALVRAQFSSVTPENVLKWESVHPQPGVFDFAAPDRYVAFGEQSGMAVIGHTLVWHSQTPRWVFQDSAGRPVSRDTLIGRMREHIQTVVGRYRGRIRGWDVVNEALNEDGSLRRTPWQSIIGDDYIAMAFRFAHEADPNAELYYNDFSLENAPKRQGAVALIRRLLAEGVPVTGIGSQDHVQMDWPTTAQLDSTLTAFGQLGVKVMITELDVDVLPRATQQRGADVSLNVAARVDLNPYAAGLPDSVQRALAQRYADLFGVYYRHRGTLTRVTFWGVTDGDSWKNNWPVRGRTNYPLLFDRDGRPKPAFDAVMRVARAPAAER